MAKEKVTDGGENDSAPDALICGSDAVDLFTGGEGDVVCFAADHRADALADGGDYAEDNSDDEGAAREVEMFLRSKSDGDTEQNDDAAGDLQERESGA